MQIIRYEEYSAIGDLPVSFQQLIREAKKISKTAYAPYSKFLVGAAALLENGKIVLGSNQENASFPAGLCGESVALFAAGANYPKIPIKAIAITASSKKKKVTEPIAPCGICRQVFVEFENRQKKDIVIILMGDRGKIRLIRSAKELLPLAFEAKYL